MRDQILIVDGEKSKIESWKSQIGKMGCVPLLICFNTSLPIIYQGKAIGLIQVANVYNRQAAEEKGRSNG